MGCSKIASEKTTLEAKRTSKEMLRVTSNHPQQRQNPQKIGKERTENALRRFRCQLCHLSCPNKAGGAEAISFGLRARREIDGCRKNRADPNLSVHTAISAPQKYTTGETALLSGLVCQGGSGKESILPTPPTPFLDTCQCPNRILVFVALKSSFAKGILNSQHEYNLVEEALCHIYIVHELCQRIVGKGGHLERLRKVHVLEILESLEILERPERVENKGESDFL